MRILSLIFFLAGFVSEIPAAVLTEDFTSDPMQRGWAVFGDASLFQWNSASKTLDVKWDSEKANSCFYKALPNILHKDDDFTISFELLPKSVTVQFNQSRSYAFEIFAIGLISTNTSSLPAFDRTTGTDSPNLAEFDYFPDTGFRATISPALVSSNSIFGTSFLFPAALDNLAWHQVQMVYTASNQVMKTTVTNTLSQQTYVTSFTLPGGFTDFALNALSITSYRDNDDTGSMIAEGSVRNLTALFPDPPRILTIKNSDAQTALSFSSRTNRVYTVETSANLKAWTATGPASPGAPIQTEILLPKETGPRFFRVTEQKP